MQVSRNLKIRSAILVLALATLACGGTVTRRELALYPTPTPNVTQTPIVIQVTTTPVLMTVEVTPTPNSGRLCVTATVAVYLRPSPSDQNYPITVLPNGTELTDLGGRNGKWIFVEFGDKQGWVHGDYVQGCN